MNDFGLDVYLHPFPEPPPLAPLELDPPSTTKYVKGLIPDLMIMERGSVAGHDEKQFFHSFVSEFE